MLSRTSKPQRRKAWRAYASIALALSVAASLAVQSIARADDSTTPFKVVTNPDNPTKSASREFLERAFLKKTSDWSDGTAIHPVDLKPGSPVRRGFSHAVLHRSISAVRSFWQQQIFSGRGVPPPEVESDAAVINYVVGHRGGVGYVSANADIGRAKPLVVE